MGEEVSRVYEFGPFQVDTAERRLLRDGEPVPLAPKAFDALLVLIESVGRTIERDDLINRLWPESFVEEGNLKVTIFKLRKALGESPDREQYIETVPRRGYRFVAPVSTRAEPQTRLILEKRTTAHVLIEQEEEQIESENEPATARAAIADPLSQRFSFSKTTRLVSLLIAALTVALFGYWVLREKQRADSTASPRSIAVLPFTPLNADESDEYLGLGIADTLITKLSRLSQVIVRSTSAVRRYAGPEQDAVAAGRELKVEAVLEGSIQRLGDRIRLTARLVSVADGKPLWADKFEAELKDVFKVQDAISEQVAAALALQLSGEDKQRLAKRYTDNTEAYQLYLKGRYYWNKRSPEGIKKGIEYFEQATGLDPVYALAYTGLADSYSMLGDDYRLQSQAAAVRALEIDDTLAEAHTSLGLLKMRREWDWPTAEKELTRALELNPHYATAHQWYSIYLELTGHSDEAVREARRAQELDPLSLIINDSFGDRLYYARQYDAAIEQLRSTIEMDPNFAPAHGSLGHVYLQQKRYDEALAAFQKVKQLSSDRWALGALGQAYALSGKPAEARKLITELQAQVKLNLASPDSIAGIYASLGDKEQALAWLERAYEMRSDLLVFLKVDPAWDRFRAEPRFQNLMRRIGLE